MPALCRGRQRRQARNPALSAAAGLGKKRTLRRSGRRARRQAVDGDGHDAEDEPLVVRGDAVADEAPQLVVVGKLMLEHETTIGILPRGSTPIPALKVRGRAPIDR